MNLAKLALYESFNLEQVNDQESGRRWYEDESGNKYPSVTTILAHAFPYTGPQITHYDYALRGTYVHEMAEAFLRHEEYKPGMYTDSKMETVGKRELADATEMFPSLREELERFKEVNILETSLVSKELKIAGRCDAGGLLYDDPGFWVIDFKTSNRPKLEKSIQSYFIQAAFYSKAIEEMYGIEIAGIKIWMVCKNDVPFLEFSKTRQELEQYIPVLRKIREDYASIYL